MIGGTKRMCEEFVLSNGLRVVADPIENFPSVSVGLWIGAGSMYESAEENGLSHFVEHILFKSMERRTTKDIAVEMDGGPWFVPGSTVNELRREALGDIVLLADTPGTAYVFALETAGELICRELLQVGRTEVTTMLLSLDEVPEFPQAERKTQTATVSSLRLDAVLAAMLHCSRGQACEWIAAGRVEINHLPAESAHAPVYEGDVFTVRGKGRFGLTALPGKSKKDRSIIEFFQY